MKGASTFIALLLLRYIVSDQGAAFGILHDHNYGSSLAEAAAYAVAGGLDLEDANDAASTVFAGLPAAIEQGLIPEAYVDRSLKRLMFVRMRTGEFDPAAIQPYRQIGVDAIRSREHLELTLRAAEESFVLLKNDRRVLPLDPSKPRRIAVVGPFSDCQSCYFGKYSPHLDAGKTVTVAAGLHAVSDQTVISAPGCSQKKAAPMLNREASRPGPSCGCASCPCPSGGGAEPYMCEDYNKTAVANAVRDADAVVLAVGLGSNVESEGRDREAYGMALPGLQNELVEDVVAAARASTVPVIALLFAAGPVDPGLFDHVDAVMYCVYPAEATGTAVARTLFGKVSPAGRLPFSWPSNGSDVPPEIDYTMAGRTYRYDQPNVRWPFGFGLSYTDFRYGKATLSASTVAASACRNVSVVFDITNVGIAASDDVAQAYLRWKSVTPSNGVNPSLSLVDFVRIHNLPAGASTVVNLTMTPRHMAVLTPPPVRRCARSAWHSISQQTVP